MRLWKQQSVRSIFVAAALTAGLAVVAPATAGVYDSAVLADSPSMYWRLGEADGAATAADASGHGVTLNYASTALVDLDAGIANETNTSAAGDAGMIAALTPANGMPAPKTVDLWLRTNPSDGATFYSYYDGISVQYKIFAGADGLVHASIVNTMNPNAGLAIDGPPSKPVADGFWHYVVVNFMTGYIYVDLVQGPPGQNPNGGGAARAFLRESSMQVLPPSINLGGPSFDGQLDEVAVYSTSLTSTQMTNHGNAGVIGWDADVAGGEEGAAAGCFERGLFWKGTANSGGTSNYTAFGSLNNITTTKQRNRCGTAPPANSGKRPTFVTGQTVRVKLDGDTPNDYVEWGPVQYFCDAATTCWGLFFNFKLTGSGTGPNDVCFKSFRAGQFLQLENCTGPSAQVAQALSTCTPTGTHGWKVQHEGTNWVGYFLCDPTTQTWLQVFSHPDFAKSSGWPDVEGFNQGYTCGTRTTANCWKREGFMGETHSNFQWQNAAGVWNPVAFGVCRIDRSLRWDGRVSNPTAPISIQIFQNIRATGC